MTETTKKSADQADAIRNKIGYPDKCAITASSDRSRDMIGNLYRASELSPTGSLQKIGQPVDKLEWA